MNKKLGGKSVCLVASFTSACKNIMRGKKILPGS